ncbi:hypothetical protein [Bacillus nakamurai]|nr:hypothetical protein [Bacillus nakamurai]MCC9023994.1 hypothetical protein [Bacillus nakamurai]MCP6683099.1 hypothetical protein [Bacillus nakamurai]MED1228015.1 hypothetical protein [Bacillus nakamurai]
MKTKRPVKQDVPLIIAASVLASSLFIILVMIGFQWQNI